MKQRDDLGRYTKVYRKANRWEVLTLYSVLGGILFAIVFDLISKPFYFDTFEVVHKVEAAEKVVTEPVEVKIRVEYNWAEERIEQEIRDVFMEEPDKAVRVAKCEGITKGKLDPKAFNPTNGSNDTGIFQISMFYHGKQVRAQELDMEDVIDNINFAYSLYKKHGWQPWKASKGCWNK